VLKEAVVKDKIRVGIVGGTGYTGVELLRLLTNHPRVTLHAITSRQEAGRSVADVFPNLRGFIDQVFLAPDSPELLACDVVFFATPNGIAMRDAPPLLEVGVRVIDLAADFRIRDIAVWQQWYGMEHTSPEWVARAVYGLPEVNRNEIKSARLIANPGCYPTATQLGFIPLLKAGLIDASSLIADVKSGVSGAGRKAETHTLFSEAADNFKAYGVMGHRHLPEIEQGLGRVSATPVSLTFTPHLTPMIRGIQATLYAKIARVDDFQAIYEECYKDEPFVDVLPSGVIPETRHVRGGNTCRISVFRPRGADTLVVLSVIDNLVKGASGQAVQNMNIMFEFPETMGLLSPALLP
jgi:N-acetyl-gamma-glutamyl-phosphate reductase